MNLRCFVCWKADFVGWHFKSGTISRESFFYIFPMNTFHRGQIDQPPWFYTLLNFVTRFLRLSRKGLVFICSAHSDSHCLPLCVSSWSVGGECEKSLIVGQSDSCFRLEPLNQREMSSKYLGNRTWIETQEPIHIIFSHNEFWRKMVSSNPCQPKEEVYLGLFGLLAGWLAGWLVGWLVSWFVGWLVS